MIHDAIIVGGGQAGLASAYCLKQRGIGHLVLNAGAAPHGSWPRYYDSLTLFSPAEYSSLPGMAFPGGPKRYPRRDEVTAYLEAYAAAFDIGVTSGINIVDITKAGGHFRVCDAQGNEYQARSIVAASGSFNSPNIPDIPGRARYQGNVIHSVDYRDPGRYKGKRVVVVGAANSAVQIAVELAGVANVTLATRTTVKFAPQTILGKDLHFWLGLTRLDSVRWLKDQSTPVLDSGEYKRTLRAGKPAARKMFMGFHESGVVWDDGKKEDIDAVIFATGFRPNWDYLGSLGVTADSAKNGGIRSGVSTKAPGLYFVGFSGQRSFSSATLRGVGRDAKFVAKRIAEYLTTCRG